MPIAWGIVPQGQSMMGNVMTAGKTAIGRRIYGLGVMALGVLALVCGTFDPGQTVPKDSQSNGAGPQPGVPHC
jgi:hypothetical protein